MTCKKSKFGVKIEGFEDLCNIHNIQVKNSTFDGVTSGTNSLTGLYDNVTFTNLLLNGKEVK